MCLLDPADVIGGAVGLRGGGLDNGTCMSEYGTLNAKENS